MNKNYELLKESVLLYVYSDEYGHYRDLDGK